MPIDCIIVEDEPLAQERLKDYILKLPFLKLAAAFDNGVDALIYLQSNTTDIVFLDINLGELSGMHILETSKISSQVIITTAYDAYALKGYELNVTDYLLKPFTFERFYQAVEKARSGLLNQGSGNMENIMFVKTETRLEKLYLNDVLFIEGMRDYRRIYTSNKRVMTLKTFKDFEKEIPPHIICRVHKSYMVGINKIESIERDRIKIMDKLIPLSETYKQSFLELINKHKNM